MGINISFSFIELKFPSIKINNFRLKVDIMKNDKSIKRNEIMILFDIL